MKPPRAQLEALLESLEGLTVDLKLSVKITVRPNDDGALTVRIADHWGYEYLRVDRRGLVTRLDAADEYRGAVAGQGRR